MMDDLGLTPVQLGYVFSAFAAGYALFQLPGGMLGHRFGARWLLTLMAIAWFILTAVTALVPSSTTWGVGAVLSSLILLRFLVGATNAPIFPVTAGGSIANWFPIGGWGFPMGLQVSALSLGAALSAPLLVWLTEAFGWRAALLLTAPGSLLVAVIWWRYMRDFPKEHPAVNTAEQALIDANRPPPESRRTPGAWKAVLANRNILLLTMNYFCQGYIFYLFFSWFFYYLVEIRQFDHQQAGIFISAQWVIGGIAGIFGGALCDWSVRKLGVRLGTRWMGLITMLLAGVFLVAGTLAPGVLAAVTLLCLSFACVMLSDSVYWVAAIAVAGRAGEVATGILNTGGNVAGFFGGMLVPFIAEFIGWTAAIASGAVFSLIAAVLWLYTRADQPMSSSELDGVEVTA
jgi:ACS family glucarate transporter-like MFS transporter